MKKNKVEKTNFLKSQMLSKLSTPRYLLNRQLTVTMERKHFRNRSNSIQNSKIRVQRTHVTSNNKVLKHAHVTKKYAVILRGFPIACCFLHAL